MSKGRYFIIILTVVMSSVSCFAQLKMELGNVKENWTLGEPIYISVLLKNESKKALKTVFPLEHFNTYTSVRMEISPKEGTKEGLKELVERSKTIFEYAALWKYKNTIELNSFYIIEKANSYRIKLIYEVPTTYYQQAIEANAYIGPTESNEIIIKVKEPTGIDKEAYDYFNGHPLWKKEELLEKYPTSTYAGWVLYRYRPDVPGAFVKNESAEKSILAVINKDSVEIKRWWQLNVLNIYDEKEKDRAEAMKILMDKTEAFVNAHPDFLYSGYLLARAGINALGLGEFQKSCLMLSQSLRMQWGIAEFKQKDLKPHKDGTEWVLAYLKEKGMCK